MTAIVASIPSAGSIGMLWYTTSSEKKPRRTVGVTRARGGTEVPHDLLGARHGRSSLGGRTAHATEGSGMMTA